MTIAESDWTAVVDLLTAADQVVLACHVQPDGDALGSLLAVGLGLRARGIPVCGSYGDEPFAIPSRLHFLPGQDLLVPPQQVPARPSVMVTFDTGSIDRLGRLTPAAEAAQALVVVDHHASNTRYGSHLLLDVDAPATAVIALDLVDRLGVELDTDIATAVYTGLVTDTGSFRFAATTPETHELAARLLRAGVAHDLVAREVFDTRGFGYLQLLGAALERSVLEPTAAAARGVVWTVVTREDRERFEVAYEEVEAVIGTLRLAVEAEVAVVCKEADDGSFVVSTRSKGAIDVGAVCVALGGGGHRFAAGYTSRLGLAETVQLLRDRLEVAAS